jgi:putative ABC transport system substrate-binding protein
MIGVLRWEGASVAERLEPFRRRLRELGYIEGQNIIVEYRFAEGRTDRAAQLAAEFVRDKADIIVAISTPAVVAAKNATQSIPIVMVAADALGTGLVASLSRPSGNVTGVSLMQPDLAGKRLEVLKDILPALSRMAFLGSTRDPAAQRFNDEARAAAERFGIRLNPVLVRGPRHSKKLSPR